MLNKNYEDFLLFSLLESMINESKLELSKGLVDILISMSSDPIRDAIMDLFQKGKDIEINQNYLEVGDKNDTITFIADSRIRSLSKDYKQTWKIRRPGGRLTFNKNEEGFYKNQSIFDDLGFDPDTNTRDLPREGTIGEIIAQTPSRIDPGKIYVLFKWDDNLGVFNKSSLTEEGDLRSRIESLSRNPTSIGRAVRAILTASGLKFVDKDLEKFVNGYKASYDIQKDAMNKFKVVSGEDIPYWYDSENYAEGHGTLGGSCMSSVDPSYFDIYAKNPDVCSMLILFAPPYSMGEDGKPFSKKIKGRALLWKTDSGELYMDRIYTNDESDISLFKKWAEENGYWSKVHQTYGTPFNVVLKSSKKEADWSVSLSKYAFRSYPYVDSFCHMDDNGNLFSKNNGQEYILNSTDGDRDRISNDDDW